MSRVIRNPPPSVARRAAALSNNSRGAARPPRLPQPSNASRSPVRQPVAARGTRSSMRGRTSQNNRHPSGIDNNSALDDTDETIQQRTVHVGDGFHMFTPSTTKREQIRRQASNEQHQYETHVEQNRLHNIHEVHRLGGGHLSEDEARRRQAEQYRQESIRRLEKAHQDQIQKTQQEEQEHEAKQPTAHRQTMETVNSSNGADRQQKTMNRASNQFNNVNETFESSSTNHNDGKQSEKLSILRDMFPYVDDQTLEYHIDVYNGDVSAIAAELTT